MNWCNTTEKFDFPYDGQIKYFRRMLKLPNGFKATDWVKVRWDEKIQEWIVVEEI